MPFSYSEAPPGGSDGKESACNARDPSSIPGLGKSPGERNGYSLQYSCLENSMDRGAWQVLKTVLLGGILLLLLIYLFIFNFLRLEYSTLAWKIPWMEEPGRLQVHGVAKSQIQLSDFTFFLSMSI